uniref:Retrotransposon protein, putative, Ty3-gypsy subclass n=1 Tax=Oryza sativa subsp. japonica TaxID=39947 RepID=Q109I5_ORYSJ|nr:retrotransposon protein, putative, Ty3-gypsy subclass [Oryza sativa Japonica Group]
MKSPTRLKEVQRLTGCMASLSRFIARMGERGQPFFALLKKQDQFEWNQEAENAFIALKRYLSNPLVLVAPHINEELFLYIATTPYSVSTVIVVEREKEQHPVYYVLANFVAIWTIPEDSPAAQTDNETWIMAFDGALNSQGAGTGLTSPTGDQFKHAIHLNFRATNNTAEYEGLLAGIKAAAALGVKRLIVKGDSELVANQVHKDYKCSNPELAKYLAEVRKLERKFNDIEVRHVYRKDNVEPDDLARRASRREPLEPGTFLDVLTKPSIKDTHDESTTANTSISQGAAETTDDWRTPLIRFLESDELPDDDTEVEKLSRQAKIYCMISNDLYKKAPNGILLKCVSSDDGKTLLLDIHEGICGSHAGARTLVGKAFRQGFFWPTTLKDACELVQRFEACQFFRKHTKLPAQALQTIPLTWPFSCWGLDILGPFPRGQGGYKFLFVPIDNFTKWIEAKPTREIKAENAIKFIKGIFCRYGLPHRILTDNGSQFTNGDFQDYCIELGVKICFASVSHPQSNCNILKISILKYGIKNSE